MKRIFDFLVALTILLLIWPILLLFCILIWAQDKHNPLYLAERVGSGGAPFTMIKLRSMIVNADAAGVDSTANDDNRITKVGAIIRRLKLDELMQLVNVLNGDMSLVGPRPNVKRETDLYTDKERLLLTVRPGISDLASIVFSDEGEILEGSTDPDIAYNQLIRPGKGHLGVLYIENQSILMDLHILVLTALVIFNRERALNGIERILKRMEAPQNIISIARRNSTLVPMPPLGSDQIVTER